VGNPIWPGLVADCVDAAFDSEHPVWRRRRVDLNDFLPRPAESDTPARMNAILLRSPWNLHRDSAAWLITFGIAWFRPMRDIATALPDIDFADG
jgi:hypothetical protein